MQELTQKYPRGATVAAVPTSGDLAGATLFGEQVLLVPVQVAPVPARVLAEARKLDIVIRDTEGKVHQ